MAIKEYKLGDICHFKTGIDPIKSEMNGDIPFIKLGNTSGFEIDYKNSEKITSLRKEKAKLNDLLLCWSCSVGKSFIVKQTCFYSTAFYKLERKDNVYLNKYMHYLFIKNEKQINKLAVGSVLKKANMNILGNYILNLPDLQTQQEIINIIEPKEQLFLKYHNVVDISDLDKFKESWSNLINIIEPFEKESEIIQSKINQLENIFNSLNMVAKEIGLMINNDVFFKKGISINSKYISNTKTDKAFLNVSAINNNINKWVNKELSIENNIRFGDVLLSLDGTIGLVNNFLSGINGYGYKVYSNSISNSQIYLSLINNFNQKIMLDGSHGSVIKHASNTRNNLILFSYGDLDIDNLYKYEISLKKQLMIVQEITKKLINYYIK